MLVSVHQDALRLFNKLMTREGWQKQFAWDTEEPRLSANLASPRRTRRKSRLLYGEGFRGATATLVSRKTQWEKCHCIAFISSPYSKKPGVEKATTYRCWRMMVSLHPRRCIHFQLSLRGAWCASAWGASAPVRDVCVCGMFAFVRGSVRACSPGRATGPHCVWPQTEELAKMTEQPFQGTFHLPNALPGLLPSVR